MSEQTVKEVAINTINALNAQLTYRTANGESAINVNIVDKIIGMMNTPVVIKMYEKEVETTSEVVTDATE